MRRNDRLLLALVAPLALAGAAAAQSITGIGILPGVSPSNQMTPTAISAGGTTVGILPTETREPVNEWIDHVVVTGIGHGRNLAVVASGDAVIAVGGRYGTLAEIGFALTLGRPVVVLEPGWQVEGAQRAQTPAEAVDLALAAARIA